MASLTQDTRNTGSMSQDSRTVVGSLTQDSKTTIGLLWSATVFPWQLDYPWLWEGNGSIVTLDTRT